MSMEGIEQNPIVYDLMSEMAFQHKKIDVKVRMIECWYCNNRLHLFHSMSYYVPVLIGSPVTCGTPHYVLLRFLNVEMSSIICHVWIRKNFLPFSNFVIHIYFVCLDFGCNSDMLLSSLAYNPLFTEQSEYL